MAEQGEETSDLIVIEDFLRKWCEEISFSEDCFEQHGLNQDEVAAEWDLPVQSVNDLAKVCDLQTLLCGNEPQDKKLYHESFPNMDLRTLQYQKKELQKRKEDAFYRSYVIRNMKYNFNQTVQNFKHTKRENIPIEKQVPVPNVVLCIDLHKQSQYKRTPLVRDQSVLVRGDMLLTEFRDSIECVNDLAKAGDFSDNLAASNDVSQSKDILRSGFFYIEDTFYNDMRYTDNKDYSKNIMDWLKKTSTKNYNSLIMDNVKFSDLTIKLGEPYLYLHQGNCEHIFSFSDLRMINQDDPQNIDDYPFVLSQLVKKRTLCKACMTYTAKWQIEGSSLTPVDPCYLCESCLNMLHYDEHGNKVGQFKAYRFADIFSAS